MKKTTKNTKNKNYDQTYYAICCVCREYHYCVLFSNKLFCLHDALKLHSIE